MRGRRRKNEGGNKTNMKEIKEFMVRKEAVSPHRMAQRHKSHAQEKKRRPETSG